MEKFILDFGCACRLEQLNPGSAVRYLPHTRPMDNCVAKIKKLDLIIIYTYIYS